MLGLGRGRWAVSQKHTMIRDDDDDDDDDDDKLNGQYDFLCNG